MSNRRVFVSYCQEDAKSLAKFRQFLQPSIRAGRIDYWADTEIQIGHEWNPEIKQALDSADLAILLISQAFLASKFIAEVEIPWLLRRQEEGEVTIFPVFIAPSTVKSEEFPYETITGEHKKAKLTKFQGHNNPDRTLKDMSSTERDRSFASLVEQILKKTAPQSRRRPTPSPPSGSALERLQAAVDLTIELDITDDVLQLRYTTPQGRTFPQRSFSWPQALKEIIEPIHQALDNYSAVKLSKWLANEGPAAGTQLFELLFGNNQAWGPLFAALFPTSPHPSPIFGDLRLHLVTSELRLLALPWRLLTFERRSLVAEGWTVVTAPSGAPAATPTTESHQEIVILEASDAAHHGLDSQRWIDVLVEHWGEATERNVRVIRSFSEIDHGPAPHLVIVLAGACCLETSSLVFDDGNFPLSQLADAWAAPPCAMAFCCLGSTGLANTMLSLGGQVPLLLWPRLDRDVVAAEATLLNWLGHWLGNGLDPIEAMHRWPRGAVVGVSKRQKLMPPHQMDEHLATLGTHAHYRQWRTRRHRPPSSVREIREHLDRVNPKGRVLVEISDLIDDPDRRVTALITYADNDNGADDASHQLRTYAEKFLNERIRLKRSSIFLPDGRQHLEQQLPGEFQTLLGKSNEHERQMLRRLGPKKVPPGQHGVLWLEWGTYGGRHRPRLKPSELEAWLLFCSTYLAHHCPPELSIVCFIALEVETDGHQRLQEILDAHHLRHRDTSFRFTPLPPLTAVPPGELLEGLEKFTRCPEKRHGEATRLLLADSQGLFEPLVQLIETAEKDGWASLLNDLKRRHHSPSSIDDEPF